MVGTLTLCPPYDSDSIVKQLVDVIVRESGRSSIPETIVIGLDVSGILDAPHARSMTAKKTQFHIPATRCARVMHRRCPSKDRGRRECRGRDAPAALCANEGSTQAWSPQARRNITAFPAQWF